jgi:hypothetical protein
VNIQGEFAGHSLVLYESAVTETSRNSFAIDDRVAGEVTVSSERPIEVPWGEAALVLDLPERLATGVRDIFSPDLEGAIADYPSALPRALDETVGSSRLEEQVLQGSRVAIVVDDPSRWTPVREALPIVLTRLHEAGVATDDVTISIGVGRHHAVDLTTIRRRVGDEVAARYRCFSPPVDDLASYVDLGTICGDTPVRVFRPVAEADLRILVGSVLPHLQAGFGGGYKLIFPGTSHRSTLGALHRHGLSAVEDAGGLLGGSAAGNPMRQAIGQAASLLGPCLSISHLTGGPGQVLQVISGRPDLVQDRLAEEARRRFRSSEYDPADIVVAGNHPWPGDPMQSFKVLLHHRAACKPGGVLVGLFWTDPNEIERSFPRTPMRAIAAAGALGGWAIRRLVPLAERVLSVVGSPSAFMLRWARELVVDRTVLVYSPPLHARIGPRLGPVRIFADQPALWRAALEATPKTGPDSPSVRIFPQGGLTYVPKIC